MKSITSIMHHEHKLIKLLIEALLANVDRLLNGSELNNGFYIDAISFIKNFADKIHHAKEEDVLFSEALNHSSTKDNPDVKLLVHQHILSRGLVELLEEALSSTNTKKIITVSREYAEIVGEHLVREEEILFPILEKELPEPIKHQIIKKFEGIDNTLSKEEIQLYENIPLKLIQLTK